MIGAHVSTQGGLIRSLERAVELKSPVIQIFVRSPRKWIHPPPADSIVTDFIKSLEATEVNKNQIIVFNHASYLINLASNERDLEVKSTRALTEELMLCDRLKIKAAIVHVGSAKQSSRANAIKRVSKNINRCLENTVYTKLLLENTAGAGGTLGRSFEELAEIHSKVERKEKIGFCIDTQHLFASGIEYDSFEKVKNITRIIKDTISDVEAIHLNDSKTPCGSNVDRHENLGKGHIGKKPLQLFIGSRLMKDKPIILEVPGKLKTGPQAEDIRLANSYLKAGIKLWQNSKP